mmetsp:Transcript_15387/g.58189  ORF Transcript_15387/g.58189 Transcript_15387/m.58189 type:complete len:214 (+) Transcript_15387:376-1017(+)
MPRGWPRTAAPAECPPLGRTRPRRGRTAPRGSGKCLAAPPQRHARAPRGRQPRLLELAPPQLPQRLLAAAFRILAGHPLPLRRPAPRGAGPLSRQSRSRARTPRARGRAPLRGLLARARSCATLPDRRRPHCCHLFQRHRPAPPLLPRRPHHRPPRSRRRRRPPPPLRRPRASAPRLPHACPRCTAPPPARRSLQTARTPTAPAPARTRARQR